MVKEAQNIKISARAWELLRWAKFELNLKSYSDVVVRLDEDLDDRSRKIQNSMKDFDAEKHRIKSKIPEKGKEPEIQKPKTILLRPDARRVLSRLKLESNEPAYTFSDAIEFLIQQNLTIWEKIPKRFK
jgi:hypothetical protein